LLRVARAAKEIVDVPIGSVIAFDELEAALADLGALGG